MKIPKAMVLFSVMLLSALMISVFHDYARSWGNPEEPKVEAKAQAKIRPEELRVTNGEVFWINRANTQVAVTVFRVWGKTCVLAGYKGHEGAGLECF